MGQRTKKRHITPQDLNLSARAINAAVNSTAFDVGDFDTMDITFLHTNSSSTDIQFVLQRSFDGGTTWSETVVLTAINASNTVVGSRPWFITTGASVNQTIENLPLNHYVSQPNVASLMRISGLVATGGDASDTVTVHITMHRSS